MYQICLQCDFQFQETSIQFSRRIKNNGPKICQECYRINHAEERAQNRIEEENKSAEEILYDKAIFLNHLYGGISVPLLMRKFKLNANKARELEHKIKEK